MVSVQEMHGIEKRAIEAGISRLMMMENAGKAVSDFTENLCRVSGKKNVLVIAGTGNNGGDSFVAARHLLHHGLGVWVALIGSEEDIRQDEARTNWEILKKTGIETIQIGSADGIGRLESAIETSDVLIVGIFGTGFRGTPRELQAAAINSVNSSGKTKVSVDLPSGMEADTGECDFAVISDYTVTMYAPKTGMSADEKAKRACGEVIVADIGVPF